jgi:hypothetical protein
MLWELELRTEKREGFSRTRQIAGPASALWSALTCQRFVRSRPVANQRALRGPEDATRRRAAVGQSGDRSPHSKELQQSTLESQFGYQQQRSNRKNS